MRLSICIPVFNFGQFLGETLDSIIPQLQQDVEILVVDGASTDDTPEVVRRCQSRCPSLRYVRLDRRGGIDVDMALSVDLAVGDYCWLFSGDDLMRPGALQQVLLALGSDHDVYVCKHANADKEMNYLGDHPVFIDDRVRTLDLADAQQRRQYFQEALTTEAIFSFMSGLVIRRSLWLSVPAPERFMGSCWGHVARLFSAAQRRLTVCYVGQIWLDKRGENDSFLDRGVVNRLRLAVDGYTRIVGHYWGDQSIELAEARRLLRFELRAPSFMYARRMTELHPGQESRAELDRLLLMLYADGSLRSRLVRLLYFKCPMLLYRIVLKSYLMVRRPGRAFSKAAA